MAVGRSGLPLPVDDVTVLATTDGGSTWARNSDPPIPPGVGSSSLSLAGIACPSMSRCLLAETFSGSPTDVAQIVVTLDQGVSWSARTLPNGTTAVASLACPSTTVCFASVTSDNAPDVIGTVDGGTTWTVQGAVHEDARLSCVSVSECYAIAPDGEVDATTDGGAHWTTQTMIPWHDLAELGGVGSASCPAPGTCYVVGQAVGNDGSQSFAYITRNGGLSWTPLTTPGPPVSSTDFSELTSISCPSATTCYARGDWQSPTRPIDGATTGTIGGVTIDAGAEWTSQGGVSGGGTVNGAPDPYGAAMDCPAIDTCFAVGATGVARYRMAVPGTFVGMTSTPDGLGYWLVSTDGTVYAFGDATFQGSMGGLQLTKPIVGMASTADGEGYWLVASDGGVFAFGDARFEGSTGAMVLNQPIVGMAASSDGGGYWLVAADGGVFAFGDAPYLGSMGATHLNRPVVGMAGDPASGGYWLVAADGGIFSFGAPFLGSMGTTVLNQPVVGMQADRSGTGYRLAAADGGVFSFGLPYFGSMGGTPLNRPVVGTTGDPETGGYWLVAADGGVFSFNAPFFGAPG